MVRLLMFLPRFFTYKDLIKDYSDALRSKRTQENYGRGNS